MDDRRNIKAIEREEKIRNIEEISWESIRTKSDKQKNTGS